MMYPSPLVDPVHELGEFPSVGEQTRFALAEPQLLESDVGELLHTRRCREMISDNRVSELKRFAWSILRLRKSS